MPGNVGRGWKNHLIQFLILIQLFHPQLDRVQCQGFILILLIILLLLLKVSNVLGKVLGLGLRGPKMQWLEHRLR